MHVTLVQRIATPLSTATALLVALAGGAVAQQDAASGSSTVFVTDIDAARPTAKRSSAAGSLKVVAPAGAVAPKRRGAPRTRQQSHKSLTGLKSIADRLSPARPRVARGDLMIVANRETSPPVKTPAKQPPARPQVRQATAPVEPVATSNPTSTRPSPITRAVREEPIADASPQGEQPKKAPAPRKPDPQPKPLDPIDQILLRVHGQSQRASAEGHFTLLIDQCVNALQLGVTGEKKQFARQMASWALNRRGQLRMDQGEQDLANADFLAALDYNEFNWRALHNRGVSFAEAGQFAEAFDDFNRVIELFPDYAKAYVNRATLYMQAHDLQAALDDYRRASEVDDQLANAHVGLARVCHMLGRLDEAVEHFDDAIRVDPANPEIVCSRGDLLADLGRYRESLADYARTIELDPEFGHAYRNGAWLLATCPEDEFRDAENAVLGARQALELGYGDRHVALDTLAAALANAGQFQDAILAITEAADLAPDEVKFTYLSRLQMYQEQQPYRAQRVGGDVAPAVYEVTDR